GKTNDYIKEMYSRTLISNEFDGEDVKITINAMEGDYVGKIINRLWKIELNLVNQVESISINQNELKVCKTLSELRKLNSGYYIDKKFKKTYIFVQMPTESTLKIQIKNPKIVTI
ncbi:MAG: DUF5110 domain-containing protein, partial [Bacteroidales bacterium]|nr:DUF5110 domain-containing protein [Bacteroidales bacterium]